MKNNYLKNSAQYIIVLFIACTSYQMANAQIPGCHAFFTWTKYGNTVTFTDSSWFDIGPQNTTWTWNFGDGDTCSLQSPPAHIYSASQSEYIACLTVTNCASVGGLCCTDTYCDTILFSDPSGIPGYDHITPGFSISPNPASNHITISLTVKNADFQVEILNALRKTIKKSAGKSIIDISLFSKGIYFIKVKERENSYIQKFIKY